VVFVLIIYLLSGENNVLYLDFSIDYLAYNWDDFYKPGGPHFSETGYRIIRADDLGG